MRKVNFEKNKENFMKVVKPFLDYARKRDDVFVGVRANELHFYVSGGRFFKIIYYPKYKQFKGEVDINYFEFAKDQKPKTLDKLLKKERSDNLDGWYEILDELREKIQKYQYKELGNESIKAEKIIQQKIMHQLNNSDSDYFAYDMEYQLQGLNDYVYKSDNENVVLNENGREKTKSLGRADIMIISKPDKDNKVTLYFMEVKHGIGAFGGVNPNEMTFGSGIVGHIKNNLELINKLNGNDNIYCSNYRRDHYGKKRVSEYKINVKERLEEEIKAIMNFFKDNKLIKNKNFKEVDYNNIKIGGAEQVFFLADYIKNSLTFDRYLGICKDRFKKDDNSKYSVKELLKNDKNLIDLYFAKPEDMMDFKYIKTNSDYTCDNFDLDIKNYEVIEKEKFK